MPTISADAGLLIFSDLEKLQRRVGALERALPRPASPQTGTEALRRGRGRPKGSKGKPSANGHHPHP